jgi:hypothetical protein
MTPQIEVGADADNVTMETLLRPHARPRQESTRRPTSC